LFFILGRFGVISPASQAPGLAAQDKIALQILNPAQRMDADPELAGVVGNNDRVRQQPLMADRAPQRAFAGNQDGIGGDFQVGQAQRLQMPLPVLGARENMRLMIRELVDHDLRQLAVFHIAERRLVDHIKRRAAAQPRQKRQARLARAGANTVKVSEPICVV
jgi:hypothetical protein